MSVREAHAPVGAEPRPAAQAEPPAPPYREVTVAAMVLGIVVGIVLTASMTYAGLVIGFVVPASAIAAILGWGLLRGVLRRGSIVENNINQTVASAVNNTAAGVIFTFPALFLMDGVSFSPWAIGVAAVAGAFLGSLFIIPLRKQMVDLERLRFPSGIAVAEILRSPGASSAKSLYLMGASVVAFAVGMLTNAEILPPQIDLGAPLGFPAYMPNVWAISLLSVGAGFLTGRAGLTVLAGGLLANWVLAPLVVQLGWVPVPAGAEDPESVMAGTIFLEMIRPLGIGLLIGGAVAGVALAAPMIRAAFAALKTGGGHGGKDELPIAWMYAGTLGSLVLLFAAAYLGAPEVGFFRAMLTAGIGTLWMWLAGVIVAQCTGMTDWSPVSGLALLAVTVVLVVSGGSVGLAVMIGAAVCVAISQGADMMTDLKTGHLVGSRPVRQQAVQLVVSWIGPIVSVLTVYLIWETMGFGPGTNIPATQAVALQQMIEAIQGGQVPVDKYAVGALVGALLTFATGGGLGVLVGLSMYLPVNYILPYGVGCALSMYAARRPGGKMWIANVGIPVAAGLLVGDSLAGVVFSFLKLFQG